MLIYKYQAETGELLGEDFADESPLEPDVFLIPANATTEAPPIPVPGRVRCYVDGFWIYRDFGATPMDPGFEPSLEQLASIKLGQIQAEKSRIMSGGFAHGGVLYDSDLAARTSYLELALKLGQNPEYATPWKASGNSWVEMNAALFQDLQPDYEAHVSGCFTWQARKQAAVMAALAAEDREALEAISTVWE